jgi:CDP-diglyceride synthetase
VITGLQLVFAILLLGFIVWVGDAVAGGIESALGEKPLRDRDA